jgi:hypothetical protein
MLIKNCGEASRRLTCDWLCDDGCVVVRVVPGVEEVVVQGSVEPVVEELDGPGVQQRRHHRPVRPPQREVPHAGQRQVAEEEEQPVEDDLVVPASSPSSPSPMSQIEFQRPISSRHCLKRKGKENSKELLVAHHPRSRSTCSNSMARSTMRCLLRAVW